MIDYESLSLDLLQDVLNNFPDKDCRLICFTIKSEKNGYEYTFSKTNGCWKCTLDFKYGNRAPIAFDAATFKIAIDRAELLSGCPKSKKLIQIEKDKSKSDYPLTRKTIVDFINSAFDLTKVE